MLEILKSKVFVAAVSFVLGTFFNSVRPIAVDYMQRRLVQFIAIKKLRIGMNSPLGGEWNHAWYARGSQSWPDENLCVVSMSSIGHHAAGVYQYQGSLWLVTASIGKDNVVTGIWKDMRPNGYRGVWLGKLDLAGGTIVGWYLGTSNRAATSAGEWVWWRNDKTQPQLPPPLLQIAPRDRSV